MSRRRLIKPNWTIQLLAHIFTSQFPQKSVLDNTLQIGKGIVTDELVSGYNMFMKFHNDVILQLFMQYIAILDRVITALDCTVLLMAKMLQIFSGPFY